VLHAGAVKAVIAHLDATIDRAIVMNEPLSMRGHGASSSGPLTDNVTTARPVRPKPNSCLPEGGAWEENFEVSFAEDAGHALATRFRAAPRASALGDLRDLLVRDTAGDPFDQPYVPRIGADFRPGVGLLVYGTAQNLQDGSYSPGADAMFRLRDAPHWRGVPIQPWSDGILPALAGVLHSACWGEGIPDLDDVVARCAVSNFFKVSLRRPDRAGDLNPVTELPSEVGGLHTELTWQHFVSHEVEILRPRGILCFGGGHARLLSSQQGIPALECNDPAWIKQGMRWAGGPNGSWTRRVGETTAALRTLVDGYLDVCSPAYSGRRRPNATTYLLNYFLDWLAMRSALS
jgi:hypothetical protein